MCAKHCCFLRRTVKHKVIVSFCSEVCGKSVMREKGVLRVADQYLSEEWGFIILNEYYLFQSWLKNGPHALQSLLHPSSISKLD